MRGPKPGEFDIVHHMAADSKGNLYTAEIVNEPPRAAIRADIEMKKICGSSQPLRCSSRRPRALTRSR